MKNNICYISNEEFTKDNMSLEHIIPNALGGKITSYHLINKHWNKKLGNEIENELIKQTPLPILLNIKRDRGVNPKISGKTESGVKYLLHDSSSAIQKPEKPLETQLDNNEI